jgi:biopolymer transport protein ExbB
VTRARVLVVLVVLLPLCLCAARAVAQEAAPGGQPAAGDATSPPAEPTGEAGPAAGPAGEVSEPDVPADVPEDAAADRELTVGEAFVLKLKQGGLTMVFLLLASVAGLGYTIERMVNLRTGAVVPGGLAEQADTLWRAGKWGEIEDLPRVNRSTLARVLAVVARHRHGSMSDASMLAGDVASRDLRRHLQKAYPLAVVATVSPLLGLLGTVIGMIGAFDKVAAAGSLGDASLLGGDISKALITTGAGLTIAVPALVLYHYFRSRTNLLALMLEEEVGELVGAWFGPQARPPAAAGGQAT